MLELRQRPLVLVVDDDLAMRMLANEALCSSEFDVIEADSGDSALELYQLHSPDAVLLDVVMDGLNGHEVCSRLRQLPGGKTVPILMMTGRDDMASIDEAFHAGATDFITKPVPYALLPHRLRYLLRAADAFRIAHDGALRLARAQRLAHLAHWEISLKRGSLRWSDEVTEIFGIPADHPEGGAQALLRWVHPEDRSAVAALFDPPHAHQIDYRMILPDGRERSIHQEAELALDPDSGESRLLGASQDMTERRQAENRAVQLAYYDSLTGLPNRAELRRHLSAALERAEQRGRKLSLLALDLDQFRRINDIHGHQVGDALLLEVAARLLKTLRSCELQATMVTGEIVLEQQASDSGMVARLGGDEFMLALPSVRTAEHAAAVAQRMIDEVTARYCLNGVEVFIAVSVGIAISPDSGRTADELFEHADAAMYHAKELGRNNYRFFDASLQQRAQRHMEIETGLKASLARAQQPGAAPELELHWQPKIGLPGTRTAGVEGLMRWKSAKLGQVSPLEFITVAEDSDLIVELGEWALRTACQVGTSVLPGMSIAINISPRQFRHPGFVQLVAETLRESGFAPALLELEITEGVVMQDIEGGQRVLKELKDLGVSIVLDDFGTGYSSLSYLMRFPIDVLKIDRSFVMNLPSKMNESVIAAIFALARSLGIDVVVEGVETEAQLRHFEQYGALEIQGYYFSKPRPAADLQKWLRESPYGAELRAPAPAAASVRAAAPESPR
jgi:diguanylate cyclase (GGDEF)-like protein